ncbi:hypothetical protein GCM10020219_054900 [Nonomuraea dietziae]
MLACASHPRLSSAAARPAAHAVAELPTATAPPVIIVLRDSESITPLDDVGNDTDARRAGGAGTGPIRSHLARAGHAAISTP